MTLLLRCRWTFAGRLALAVMALPCAVSEPQAGREAIYTVRNFGARADGKTDDSPAVNRAVEACAKAGGGQVRFTPGRYLCSSVRLRSGVHLWLEAGATISGSPNPEAYASYSPAAEAPEAKFGARWHRALIIGDSVEDASIQGPGEIDGSKVFDSQGEEKMRGPHTILLGNCRRILIRGLTVRDSANYALLMEGCDDIDVRSLTVKGGWDGIHFRGWPGRPCRRVTIADCHLFTGDDAIAGRYWEDTLISNCVLNSSCNGIRLIGPASGLLIDRCLMYGPGRYEHRSSHRNNMLAGLCLQPGAWDATAGAMERVIVSDVTMHDVTTPLFCVVKPGNSARDIRIDRLTATGVYLTASSIESWAENPVDNVALTEWSVTFRAGERTPAPAASVRGPGVDARPLPVWGLYGRRVDKLRLANVRFYRDGPARGGVIQIEQAGEVELDGVQCPADAGALNLKGAARIKARDVDPPISGAGGSAP